MDRRQTIVIVAIVFVTIAVVAGVAIYAQRDVGASVLDSSKRFTAKAGTTRANAIALSSAHRRGVGLDTQSPGYQPEDANKASVKVKSLSDKEPTDDNLSPEDELIREALNAYSAEAGIDEIQAALRMPHTPDEVAKLETALGQLHAQRDPPDYAAAHAAFERARASASRVSEQHAVAYAQAQVLLSEGRASEARAQLESALASASPQTPQRLRMSVLLARLQESDAAYASAKALYAKAIETVVGRGLEVDAEAESIARLAALRLARLYRLEGRHEKARELSAQFKRRAAEAP